MFETLQNRPLAIHTPLGVDALLLTRFSGSTGLSELFRFEPDLLAALPGIPSFDKLLGQTATVRIRQADGSLAFFHGLVSRLERLGRDRTHVQYRAWLAPNLWTLTKKVQSRIFQQQAVPDVLQAVFEPLRPDVEFKLQKRGEYAPRDYCVQYRESDFAFASRLMEEEGIYYYFEHSDQGHKLIVTDSHTLLPAPAELSVLEYDEAPGGTRDSVRVTAWHKRQDVCSGTFSFWDQCFELPDREGYGFQTLETRKRVADSVKAGQAEHTLNLNVCKSLEVQEYPGGYAKDFDGISPDGAGQADRLVKLYDAAQRRAARRAEAEAASALRCSGASNAALLSPGHKLRLLGPLEDAGQYYVCRIEHEARLSFERSGEDQVNFDYGNRFECLPVDLPFRAPELTPKPTILGVQTATVVGPKAGEAGTPPHLDKYGRVKVQFHWDRTRKFDGHSSCWLRVGQIWAGQRWGAFFWPRPGHEVIVAFENGDPDTPIITGSVYNAVNMPPLALPEGKYSSGLKSNTPKGDPFKEANCLVFHDQPGTEFLQIHSMVHEVAQTSATRAYDITGPTVETYGRLAFPVPGSGSGSGHDDKSSNEQSEKDKHEHEREKEKREAFEKLMEEYKKKEKEEEEKRKKELASKKPPKVIGLGGIFLGLQKAGLKVDKDAADKVKTALDWIGDWKAKARKELGGLIGGWVGDTFPAKTEYVCGDRHEVKLYGKHTEHLVWGDKQEYLLVNPVDLLESVAKDLIGGFSAGKALLEGYKKVMWGLKLGPEPTGNFEYMLGKKTDFQYYGPFTDVKRGKSYEYEAEKFSLFNKKPVDVAVFFLALGLYTTMSITDILGRKYNTFDEEGEIELEHFWFVNANVLVNKLAGILFEVESANAKTHQAKEDKKKTDDETKLSESLAKLEAGAWEGVFTFATKSSLKAAAQNLKNTTQSVKDAVDTVAGNVTALTQQVQDLSTRHTLVFDDAYEITAHELKLTAEDRAQVPTTYGNITIAARGGTLGDGAVRLEGGSGIGAGVALVTPNACFALFNEGPKKQIECINANPGQIVISQGGLPTSPVIKMVGLPTQSLTMSVGAVGMGPQIKLSSTALELSFGPPAGGAKITLNNSGIELATANGANKLKIGMDGIEVQGLKILDKAVTQLQVQGIQIAETAEAIQTIKFGLIKID